MRSAQTTTLLSEFLCQHFDRSIVLSQRSHGRNETFVVQLSVDLTLSQVERAIGAYGALRGTKVTRIGDGGGFSIVGSQEHAIVTLTDGCDNTLIITIEFQ